MWQSRLRVRVTFCVSLLGDVNNANGGSGCSHASPFVGARKDVTRSIDPSHHISFATLSSSHKAVSDSTDRHRLADHCQAFVW